MPNEGLFNVSVGQTQSGAWTILVFDPLGVKIHEETCLTASGALERTIDLRPVPPGIYTLVIENSVVREIRKIVVRH